jgi:hypothetical protein
MQDLMNDYFPFAFPVFFLAIWLAVTIGLGSASGWYSLARRYPDRNEAALLQLNGQSGTMRGVGMRGILRIAVCPSGLRLGIMRIFGPFCRDFFVPWEQITVTRKDRFFWKSATFQFGNPIAGTLSIASHVADRLAQSAPRRWPEQGPFEGETNKVAGARLFKQWALLTFIAATFFIVVPRLMAPPGAWPPIAVAILFPAVVIGVSALIQYAWQRKKGG